MLPHTTNKYFNQFVITRRVGQTNMFSHTLALLVGYMAVASSRELAKPMPTITNSLVNLGKMEVSIYFSGNGRDGPSHAMKPDHGPSIPPPFFPKLETIAEEPCPCSSLRNSRDSFPTGIINKILSSGDLFSFHNDPLRSSLCCDSHEHIQEGSVYFEFTPEQKPMKAGNGRSNPQPMMPFLFDSVIPNKSMLPATKTKAIEVFLFPKKRDMVTVMNGFEGPKFSLKKQRDTVPKEGITVVGSKKLENNIDLYKPPPPPVKKDLSAQQQAAKVIENEKPAEEGDKIIIEPASKPNAVNTHCFSFLCCRFFLKALLTLNSKKAALSIVSTDGRLAALGSSIPSPSAGSSHNLRPSHRCLVAVLVLTPK
ncbi:hypothetical protein PYW08_016714 [Mythimna loreyi]|uniref:Uncharacterized protein n=1 Tax=Mythimna loreyi TaxID=667449 RepID=A0ACC2R310_9NEOP|nr:hypothetical protein PYW08_016714 [Mythimna loreyi]